MTTLVLSLFPGIGLLDLAFEEQGYCVVRGPDLLWGGNIERALLIARHKVAVLQRVAFLAGQKRAALYRRTPLARVHVFPWRISMPPGEANMSASGGSVDFAWFVWDADHQGPPQLGWLEKPAPGDTA